MVDESIYTCLSCDSDDLETVEDEERMVDVCDWKI